MQLIAITKWGAPMQTELPELAARLGVVAYDLRIKLAGVLPVFFTTTQDAAQARAHVDFLRGRGHGAVLCDLSALPDPTELCVPKEFTLGDDALSGRDTAGRPFEISCPEVSALLRMGHVRSADQTLSTKSTKLSLGRAALSGGMVMTKTVETQDRSVSQEREQVLYMFCRGSDRPTLWREQSLRYMGLGDAIEHSSMQNFALLVQELRQRCPGARYDDSMLAQKRRTDISLLVSTKGEQRVEQSNDQENTLAATVMHRAQLEGQL